MITMRIKGGLGNQLFQYAAAYALSKRLNQPFQFNPSFTATMTARGYKFPELNVDVDTMVSDNQLPRKVGRIKNAYINKVCRVFNCSKHKCGDYLYWLETKDEWQPEFFTIENENLYVDGYFQSEEYFKEYRAEFLRQISPRYEAETPFLEILEQIMNCNSVAVHVRRSDFKKDNNPFHYLMEEDYYQKAVNYMREKLDDPTFFWFSDDMDWVIEHIGDESDFRFVSIRTAHGDIDDMMLMKNCNHIITANSTFSWWAAWLNEHEDAVRVVPERPYGMDGMIPKNWVKI